MKIKLLTALCLSLSAFYTQADPALYAARSQDKRFDLSVTEYSRSERRSELKVPGFHERSAPGSRWLMCRYTDLAIVRGFEYWAVLYPQAPNENLTVVFPSSMDEGLTDSFGSIFSGENLMKTMPVHTMAAFCAGNPR